MADDSKALDIITTTSHQQPRGSTIAPIQAKDVRRIVAGQVISDLASSVKELVDNALDSGAKSITIRLFNQGIDIIEVSDDGSGVPAESRPLLAVKHATSKIKSFEELSVDHNENGQMQTKTLGFRGEALFSLANISKNLIVSTRTADDSSSMGEKMEFQKDGTLDLESVTQVARKVGTTVAVVKLFDALPVRRADLIKRIKSQRAKMLRLLQSYAVLCVGVKFHLIDVSGPVGSVKCKTEVKMSTSNNTKCIKETISQVFGSRFLSGLCTVKVDLSSVVSTTNGPKDDTNMWRIEGLVSRAPSSDARGNVARDIQFFSINRRPVELPKISKVIAEAWRNFESVTGGDALSKKRPACFLAIYLPSSLFDVNVSPDKREVLLSEETECHDLLRKALIELWSNQTQGKFVRDEVHMVSAGASRHGNLVGEIEENEQIIDKRIRILRKESDLEKENDQSDGTIVGTQNKRQKVQNKNIDSEHDECRTTLLDKSTVSNHGAHTFVSQEENAIEKMDIHVDDDSAGSSQSVDTISKDEHLIMSSASDRKMWNQTKLQFSPAKLCTQKEEIETLNKFPETQQDLEHTENSEIQVSCNASSSQGKFLNSDIASTPRKISAVKMIIRSDSEGCLSMSTDANKVTPIDNHEENESSDSDQESDNDDENDRAFVKPSASDYNPSQSSRREEEDEQKEEPVVIWSEFNTASVLESSMFAREQSIKRSALLSHARTRLQKEKQEGNGESMDKADRNSLYLSKDDFPTMSILGQFNLGFILALDQGGHLWILDQHACDEKYNFEKLCKETKVHEQKLIAPLPLELSPSEENCILEHMYLFEQNGFQFDYDSSKPPRHRLSLIAVPHSGSGGDGKKAVQFGPQDVGALCALLGSDGACSSNGYISGSGTGSSGTGKMGNNAVRRHAGFGKSSVMLPKAVAMFASRACRSSIMVGQALSQRKMQQIVQNLQVLDHPWTCAHGRPTVRHVKDLMDLLADDESSFSF